MQNPIYLPPSAEQIRAALLTGNENLNPLDELLSTVEAVFYFVRLLDIDPDLKMAFEPMYRQFRFYSNMVVLASGNGA